MLRKCSQCIYWYAVPQSCLLLTSIGLHLFDCLTLHVFEHITNFYLIVSIFPIFLFCSLLFLGIGGGRRAHAPPSKVAIYAIVRRNSLFKRYLCHCAEAIARVVYLPHYSIHLLILCLTFFYPPLTEPNRSLNIIPFIFLIFPFLPSFFRFFLLYHFFQWRFSLCPPTHLGIILTFWTSTVTQVHFMTMQDNSF